MMPGILRFLDVPGLRNHGRFGFREHPTESDSDLLNGEFIALVEDDDVEAASEISERLEAGEPIAPLPRRNLYQLQQEREATRRKTNSRRKPRMKASRRLT